MVTQILMQFVECYSNQIVLSNLHIFHSSQVVYLFLTHKILWLKKVFKDYFLFPHVGRMDDIWAAFYVTAKNYKVIYSKPTVFQKEIFMI